MGISPPTLGFLRAFGPMASPTISTVKNFPESLYGRSPQSLLNWAGVSDRGVYSEIGAWNH